MSHCKTMVPMRGLGGQWMGGASCVWLAVTVRQWHGTWMMSSRVSRAMRDTSAARLPSTCVSTSCSGGLGLHSNTSLVDHSSLSNIGLPFHSRQTALCFWLLFLSQISYRLQQSQQHQFALSLTANGFVFLGAVSVP